MTQPVMPLLRGRGALITASATVAILLPLLILEGLLRFLPVMSDILVDEVNQKKPVLKFVGDRAFTYSHGWQFDIVNHGRINNYGFVNDLDYARDHRTPLVAVIGDSFVEAMMVPYQETLHGRLNRRLGGGGRAYSFGIAGAQLSQYLVYADYARIEFAPEAMVFVIVGNDFDESWLEYRNHYRPGFHYFVQEGPRLGLTRLDYAPSQLKRFTHRSALVRYLDNNVHIRLRLRHVLDGSGAQTRYAGYTRRAADKDRVRASRLAVDEFFRELPSRSGLDRGCILFVLDGLRPDLYSEAELKESAGVFFQMMRGYFLQSARDRGYEVIDLQPLFIQRHRADNTRFEFPTDGHWNSAGHAVAADAVALSKVFRATFGDDRAQAKDTGTCSATPHIH